ncbi:unnamed protein product, partial [marine sediment metagenome]
NFNKAALGYAKRDAAANVGERRPPIPFGAYDHRDRVRHATAEFLNPV